MDFSKIAALLVQAVWVTAFVHLLWLMFSPRIKKMIDEKKVAELGPNPAKFILDSKGWLKYAGGVLKLVKEIEKVPGLKYYSKRIHHEYNPDEEYVFVSNETGQAIEIYIKNEGYSDLTLNEFLTRTLFDRFLGQMNENILGQGDKSINKVE